MEIRCGQESLNPFLPENSKPGRNLVNTVELRESFMPSTASGRTHALLNAL